MDWLKDKPGLQWMLNTLSSVLLILLAFWLTGWSAGKQETVNSIRVLEMEKASYSYVDNKDSKLEGQIENKADKSLVESMDKKLDLILIKLN